MARGLNKVQLIGRIGNDIEPRSLNNGSMAVTLSIATDESYKNRDTGQIVEQTEWHRVSAFGRLAEIIAQYLSKGSQIYIEGRLRTREWEKDGIKRYTTEIVAANMMMLDSKKQDTKPAGKYQAYQNKEQHAPVVTEHLAPNELTDFDDDIPF